MKKLVAFVLVFLLTLAMCVPSFAAECQSSEYDQLISIAKATFPEYVDKLEGNNNSSNARLKTAETVGNLVQRETRPVDNDTILTYSEYDSGAVTLGMARFKPTTSLNVDNEETLNTFTQFTATIVASVLDGPTFTATNVKYRIYPSDYDRIISAGSYSIPGYTSSRITYTMGSVETSTTPAFVTYFFPCPVGETNHSGAVQLQIINNKASVTFDIW